MVDPTASSLLVSVGSKDFSILQSPGLLRSSAASGTTGAVLWKITPLLAAWLEDRASLLWNLDILWKGANVVEVGSGGTGLLGLAICPLVRRYILTDQPHMMKLLKRSVEANSPVGNAQRPDKVSKSPSAKPPPNLQMIPLDWETDSVRNILGTLGDGACVDLLVASDCVYNTHLIKPFVQTCQSTCALRPVKDGLTVVLIAQQIRSDEVLAGWLSETLLYFHVWRIPDHCLPKDLTGSGYVLYLTVLRANEMNHLG